jgi:hypothetical protein
MVYSASVTPELLTSDLNGLTNDQLYAAIVSFATTQPCEGWRHDYTETWDEESALAKIAAFANTFGGVLIVGIRKRKSDPSCQIVGVPSTTEYKTKIASSIGANLSPTPFYEIFESHPPGDTTRRFCIVRVRSGNALHLLTKKGMHPAYVRNEDEAKPANAAQLRALIQRERNSPQNVVRFPERAAAIRDALNIRRKYKDPNSKRWFLSASEAVDTFFKVELIPSDDLGVSLDREQEQKFRSLISACCPRIAETEGRVANETAYRGADHYQYIWYHKNIDYEVRWHITETGEIGQGSRMEYQNSTAPGEWSVVDLVMQAIIFVRLGLTWWRNHGYFGDGRLFAQLNVGHLRIAQGDSGSYTHLVNLMHPRLRGAAIPSDVIELGASSRTAANADIAWSYFFASESAAKLLTPLLNQLLRGLGHSSVWRSFEENIHNLVAKSF